MDQTVVFEVQIERAIAAGRHRGGRIVLTDAGGAAFDVQAPILFSFHEDVPGHRL